jgi:hypothetical protein
MRQLLRESRTSPLELRTDRASFAALDVLSSPDAVRVALSALFVRLTGFRPTRIMP